MSNKFGFGTKADTDWWSCYTKIKITYCKLTKSFDRFYDNDKWLGKIRHNALRFYNQKKINIKEKRYECTMYRN